MALRAVKTSGLSLSKIVATLPVAAVLAALLHAVGRRRSSLLTVEIRDALAGVATKSAALGSLVCRNLAVMSARPLGRWC